MIKGFYLVACLIVGGLAVCTAGVVVVARSIAVPPVIELPRPLLPGNPVPADAVCDVPTMAHGSECLVKQNGKTFHLDQREKRIVQTVTAAHEYTLGDLILAWGAPSSFAQFGCAADVYWGTRYAYLITCSLRPDSPVELIAYYPQPSYARAWHGFTSQRYGCSDH